VALKIRIAAPILMADVAAKKRFLMATDHPDDITAAVDVKVKRRGKGRASKRRLPQRQRGRRENLPRKNKIRLSQRLDYQPSGMEHQG